jgi:hypothetical protein
MVNKAGANKGRSFFCCGKQTGPACRSFFKWSDTLPRSLLQHPTHPMTLLRVVLLLLSKEGWSVKWSSEMVPAASGRMRQRALQEA